jgi:replication factor A1
MIREDSSRSELRKIENLTPRSREVNASVQIVSITPVREVRPRRDYLPQRICDALVGDETASIYLTLWDDNIDKINEEATLRIENGHVKLFR